MYISIFLSLNLIRRLRVLSFLGLSNPWDITFKQHDCDNNSSTTTTQRTHGTRNR